jgi:hypothetical protein
LLATSVAAVANGSDDRLQRLEAAVAEQGEMLRTMHDTLRHVLARLE